MISFNKSKYSVNEDGGQIQLTLILSNPSSTDITIQVTASDGTATSELAIINSSSIKCILTGGDDYDSGPFSAIFPAGKTVATFNVSIIDDDIVEGTETFELSINPFSLPSRASVHVLTYVRSNFIIYTHAAIRLAIHIT